MFRIYLALYWAYELFRGHISKSNFHLTIATIQPWFELLSKQLCNVFAVKSYNKTWNMFYFSSF